MKSNSLIVAALAALTLTCSAAAQRKADVRLVNGNIEARIIEPNGVDVYFVFQGVGIGGPVEIPATLGGCGSPIFITIGPLAAHNHQHTIHWTDCNNTTHRWSIPIPVNGQWFAGSAMPVAAQYGWGCGQGAPVDLDIDAEPALGTTRTLMVTNLPAGTTLAAAFLARNPAPGWGYSLSQLGIAAAECYVFVDLNGAMGLGAAVSPSSAASFSLSLPMAPALAGLPAYAQAAALSPGQNPAGMVTSNGLSMILAL